MGHSRGSSGCTILQVPSKACSYCLRRSPNDIWELLKKYFVPSAVTILYVAQARLTIISALLLEALLLETGALTRVGILHFWSESIIIQRLIIGFMWMKRNSHQQKATYRRSYERVKPPAYTQKTLHPLDCSMTMELFCDEAARFCLSLSTH